MIATSVSCYLMRDCHLVIKTSAPSPVTLFQSVKQDDDYYTNGGRGQGKQVSISEVADHI